MVSYLTFPFSFMEVCHSLDALCQDQDSKRRLSCCNAARTLLSAACVGQKDQGCKALLSFYSSSGQEKESLFGVLICCLLLVCLIQTRRSKQVMSYGSPTTRSLIAAVGFLRHPSTPCLYQLHSRCGELSRNASTLRSFLSLSTTIC